MKMGDNEPAKVPNNNNQDELIIQQQRNIEKEISESIPLISGMETISALENEYLDDTVYATKVQDLASKYKSIRRVRPDGNCFFRGFAYAYIEHISKNKTEFEEFKKLAAQSKDKLVQLGFPVFTLEDFHDTFMEVVDRVSRMVEARNSRTDNDSGQQESPPPLTDEESELHKVFNEASYSDYVVVYLRLLTSGSIQENADFYQDFIGGYSTVEDFRHQEVEPMYKESDHIHIIAICNALNASVRVEYMDRGGEGGVKAHDFPEDKPPCVFLLYRPGHYDVLYPK